jgi:hypothetical protein
MGIRVRRTYGGRGGAAPTRVYETVTLEMESELPGGFPEHVVRTVTENGRTLKFTSQGFESE